MVDGSSACAAGFGIALWQCSLLVTIILPPEVRAGGAAEGAGTTQAYAGRLLSLVDGRAKIPYDDALPANPNGRVALTSRQSLPQLNDEAIEYCIVSEGFRREKYYYWRR